MRIAVYGGSFDPPHAGHVTAARAAYKALRPDVLLIVPACVPPHKALTSDSASAVERLRMCNLAFGDIPGCMISDAELRRGGVSYTSDTLRELNAEYPDAQLYLLMGSDMLLSIDRWHEPDAVISLARPVVFDRGADCDRYVSEKISELHDRNVEVAVIPNTPIPIASRELRPLLARGEGADSLPETVYSYVIRKRLYGAVPELSWLREASKSLYKEKRLPHVRGCEAEAVSLAKRWGADERLAAEAGILHDITKKNSYEEQLILCDRYGILNDNAELCALKLLHAKTGAALARELFGVTEQVYDAIRWHTTGRPNMTLLEKIVYLADYIEPTRNFDGVSELRRLAYKNIDDAMRLGLEMSLREIRERGNTPHLMTVRALSFLVRD